MRTEVALEGYAAETCCDCGIKYFVPLPLQQVALIRCEEFRFWCPNGHPQSYRRNAKDGSDDDPDPGEDITPDEDGEVVQFPVLKVVA